KRRGVGDCAADTILSAPGFALGGCCMLSSFSQWYGRVVLVVGVHHYALFVVEIDSGVVVEHPTI
ncbi:hypothetical protein J6590_070032, partial [Homalodisca vitripennis]